MTPRKASIHRQLMAMILGTSGLVLLVTCSAFLAYELLTFRETGAQQLSTLGKVIAANSTAALAFQNPDDAGDVLRALRAEPNVIAAVLYDEQGNPFASYPDNPPAGLVPDTPGADGYRLEHGRLVYFQPVEEGTSGRLGTLYLTAGLAPFYARLRMYAIIALLAIGASLFLAYALSGRLQRQIAQPILALADVAEAISRRHDYGVRAPKLEGGELAMLTDAFNHMLAEVQTAEARMQSQLARLDLLNRITRAVGERQDLPSVFRVVIGTLENDLPIDFGCVCLYDPAREILNVTAVGARSQAMAGALEIPELAHIPAAQDGLSRCVRGDLVHTPDVAAVQSPFAQNLSRNGLRSLVAAPLLLESNVFGVLIAARREPHSFSTADCEFLRQLSEHVALAAHQTQIHTALQQAYDDLRQSQHTIMEQERLRALGQMASGIAHDINNAISPVALYVEALLEKEPQLSPRARDYLQTIDRAISDVAGTVARMREFYRSREPEIMLTPADLSGLAQQVLDLTRVRWSDIPQQRGAVIDLRTELAPNLPRVMVAEGEVRDALTNLVFNAVDAMPDGGTLTIRTKVTGHGTGNGNGNGNGADNGRTPAEVEVSVTDTGAGMDPDTRERCLEPFFTTKGERGTGLGLAMVYGMVQRHSAGIEIESALGVGTTVRLRFAVPVGVTADTGEHTAVGAGGHLRILLVDDDPMLLKALRDTLEGDNHDVVAAGGGRQGIDTFLDALQGGRPFDVVITDLGMPYVDGRQVASEIKHASVSTPIILLTGWGQRLLAEGDIPPHIDRLLSKPPRLSLLREALAQCMPTRTS